MIVKIKEVKKVEVRIAVSTDTAGQLLSLLNNMVLAGLYCDGLRDLQSGLWAAGINVNGTVSVDGIEGLPAIYIKED